jgi:hypothetical protein
MILTDSNGRPLDPPTPPAPDAPIEEKIAWLRADAAFRDRVASLANEAFVNVFRKEIKR